MFLIWTDQNHRKTVPEIFLTNHVPQIQENGKYCFRIKITHFVVCRGQFIPGNLGRQYFLMPLLYASPDHAYTLIFRGQILEFCFPTVSNIPKHKIIRIIRECSYPPWFADDGRIPSLSSIPGPKKTEICSTPAKIVLFLFVIMGLRGLGSNHFLDVNIIINSDRLIVVTIK